MHRSWAYWISRVYNILRIGRGSCSPNIFSYVRCIRNLAYRFSLCLSTSVGWNSSTYRRIFLRLKNMAQALLSVTISHVKWKYKADGTGGCYPLFTITESGFFRKCRLGRYKWYYFANNSMWRGRVVPSFGSPSNEGSYWWANFVPSIRNLMSSGTDEASL